MSLGGDGDVESLEQRVRALELARENAAPTERVALSEQAARYELRRGRPGRARQALGHVRASVLADDLDLDLRVTAALAEVSAWEGRVDDARASVDPVVDSSPDSEPALRAQGVAVLGDVAAAMGDVDVAISHYGRALDSFDAVQNHPERVRLSIRLAASLLDRGGPVDTSAAATSLGNAREIADVHDVHSFQDPLELVAARARAQMGDPEGGLGALQELTQRARSAGDLDTLWQVEAAAAEIERHRGADFAARRHDIESVEVLEGIAMRLGPDGRAAFWGDVRRATVRSRASAETGRAGVASNTSTSLEPSTERLLEILKRLAREHDKDRLLERITDSAVELSGAERGIVLLEGKEGSLEPYLYRHASISDGDPSVAFSRSIAESVMIDGDPLITLDAQGDRRLTEYLSVHQLALRSVACVPIRADGEVLGVLYLEHRLRAGRFHESDLSLLLAFADQAAIALRNASLLERLDERGRALEQVNADLRAARDELASRLVSKSEQLEQARMALTDARQRLEDAPLRHGIVGKSATMGRVFSILDRVAERDVPVVVQGESGTGKELVAQAVHRASGRSSGPFVAVNCAAIPEALLESELFGHAKGAFTGADRSRAGLFERAGGGTLFLDEVGDMPAKMQVALLRVLAEGRVTKVGSLDPVQVDVRVVCATQRPLRDLVSEGKFREDLYYRLEVVVIPLPPLRDRRDDIPLLADHFLARIAATDGAPRRRMSRGALERLMGHPLPGNVRQLEHLLLNASVMGTGDIVLADDLALDGVSQALPPAADLALASAEQPAARPPPRALSQADYKSEERRRILEALDQSGWNRARAARALGMPRRTFYRRLKQHDIL